MRRSPIDLADCDASAIYLSPSVTVCRQINVIIHTTANKNRNANQEEGQNKPSNILIITADDPLYP